ncbi:hydroxymethylglutaryl-CoA synthase family protein [soil metagenome]
MSPRCIVSVGGYIPLLRLDRKAAASSLRWSGLAGPRTGSRSVAGWDEDPVTLAVEAARVARPSAADLKDVVFASTSAPFFERSQATLVIEALGLTAGTTSQDVAGSRRAATSALMRALETGRSALIASGEKRPTKTGNAAQLAFGDGGAAIVTGSEGPVRYLGGASLSHDFLDIYSSREHPTPYAAEERFVRDIAVSEILVPTIRESCADAGVNAAQISLVAFAEPVSGAFAALSKALGLTASNVGAELTERAGNLGAAHPLFAFALACDRAKPGDIILLVGFGSGCDALLFEIDGPVPGASSASAALSQGRKLDDYVRFLNLVGAVEMDWGVRAETEQKAAATVLNRYGRDMMGFVGGRDVRGNVQFPKTRMPVDPEATGPEPLEDTPLADVPARLVSLTADRLNFTPDPPFHFGLVQFDNGARVMMEFTDADSEGFTVGQAVAMRFRIKSLDRRRGSRTYFWKAAPAQRPTLEA